MAHVYVDSNAAGAGTGADWANAYTTLAAALTAKAAGDDFWVAHNHAETAGATKTHTSPGNSGSPCRIACVNSAGTVPPVAADLRTTATITTTGAFGIVFAGYAYCYGITFNAGTGAVSQGFSSTSGLNSGWHFELCSLNKLGTTGSLTAINLQATNVFQHFVFDNTTVSFGATGDGMRGRITWLNTANAITGSTFPSSLFIDGGTPLSIVECRGVDFSAIAGTIVASGTGPLFYFQDCKFHASATLYAGPQQYAGQSVYIVRSDSAGTNYRHEKRTYAGSQVVETTIVRTGGASDGTTPISWKFVTGSGAKFQHPFISIPMSVWVDSTASTTLTVYGVWGGGAVPTNADIWMEASYLGDAASPLASLATNGPASFLTTATDTTADASVWGGSTTAFRMAVTFTPAQKGFVTVYIKVAAASATIYIDPKIAIS